MDELTGDLDKMIDSVEETMIESRQLDLLFDVMLREREQQQLQREQQQRRNTHTHGGHGASGEEEDGYRHIPSINDHPLSRNNPLASITSSHPSLSRSNHHHVTVDWQDVLVRAAERGFGECAICMGCNLNTRVSSISPGTNTHTPSNRQ